MKLIYMHLMDGRPAEFTDVGRFDARLTFCGVRCLRVAKSLRQIRKEQAVSRAFYKDGTCYAYVRVTIK